MIDAGKRAVNCWVIFSFWDLEFGDLHHLIQLAGQLARVQIFLSAGYT